MINYFCIKKTSLIINSMMKVLVLILLLGACCAKPLNKTLDEECLGYKACAPNDPNKLNVHVIVHSHDDVGWTSTVDEYYYTKVDSIISSAVGSLLQNEQRRFIQVETAFFQKWWDLQTDYIKDLVKDLVNQGRLEIIGGAWSMNDEAAAHYQSTIDQFTLGLKFLEDNLGKCGRPRSGWQIDPFGHSREQASIFSQLGYESVYFARIDYRDKNKRKEDKSMDLLWRGSQNLGVDSTVFASAFYDMYSPPDGFNFDIRCCGGTQIVMNEKSPEYNWKKRVNEMVDFIKSHYVFYPTNNLLFTFGSDFSSEAAERTFNNIDKLMLGFDKFKPTIDGMEINFVYSTPTCYVKAVNDFVKAKNLSLDLKTDDFFPYADSPNKVWSGYYTSRPTSKRYERIGNNLLQVSRQISTLAGLPKNTNRDLEEAMGIFQHHDAVSGTEKQAVEKDYHRLLSIGINEAVGSNNKGLSSLLQVDDLDLKHCPLANISICDETDRDEFNVLLYNPLARSVSHYIQVPVTGDAWAVTDPDGEDIEVAVTEPTKDYQFVVDEIGGKLHTNILIFKADLPAVGYKVYNIKRISSENSSRNIVPVAVTEDTVVGWEDKYVTIDGATGRIKSITLNNVSLEVDQEMMYYRSAGESGAYIFRTDQDDRNAKQFSEKAETYILNNEGNVVREVKQIWKDWARQVVRIYKDEDFVEFDFTVGPIDVSDDVGKEVILRYSTQLKTDGVFYTDSNGREMLYRKKDWRETYDYTTEEPQANNYYPVTARISINDGSQEFAVLTDRAEGGGSLDDGQVELMVHRALLHDDGKGVGENLNEIEYNRGVVARGSHYVTLGDKKYMAAVERSVAQRKLLAPWLFITTKEVVVKTKTFLNKELPQNIHLLTLDKWDESKGTLLIRFEHVLEKNEDEILSKEVTIDVSDLFATFTVTSLEETLLAGTVPLAEATRLTWPQLEKTDEGVLSKENRLKRNVGDLNITLAPMQIRTFIATVVVI